MLNKKISTINIEKIIIIFLYLQPFIDVFTGIMLHYFKTDITVGVVTRIIFLLFLIFYELFIFKGSHKKKTIIYLSIIFLYFILFLLNIYFSKDIYVLSFEFKSLIKVFYFPICLVIIYDLVKEKKLFVDKKHFRNLFLIYLFFVFIPNILGLGFDAYKISKGGSIGFFYTANEISAILSILFPIFIYEIIKTKNYFLTIILIVITLYTITSMGTKTVLLSLIIVMTYYIAHYIIDCFKCKKYKNIGIISLLAILVFSLGVVLIPKTSFYKNIMIHLDYLEIKSIKDFNSFKKIDHFIFSERLSFLKKTNNIYKKANLSSKILGIGYVNNYSTDDVSMKLIEMDYFDIFYRHGIVGFIIYFSSFIYLLFNLYKKYFQRKNIISYYNLSLILVLVLSLLTGHVLTSPSVSIFIALIINMFYNNLEEGEKTYGKVRLRHS